MIPQPRGRPRKDCVWNPTTGVWDGGKPGSTPHTKEYRTRTLRISQTPHQRWSHLHERVMEGDVLEEEEKAAYQQYAQYHAQYLTRKWTLQKSTKGWSSVDVHFFYAHQQMLVKAHVRQQEEEQEREQQKKREDDKLMEERFRLQELQNLREMKDAANRALQLEQQKNAEQAELAAQLAQRQEMQRSERARQLLKEERLVAPYKRLYDNHHQTLPAAVHRYWLLEDGRFGDVTTNPTETNLTRKRTKDTFEDKRTTTLLGTRRVVTRRVYGPTHDLEEGEWELQDVVL